MKYIKNISQIDVTLLGQLIPSDTYFEIPKSLEDSFGDDLETFNKIFSQEILISQTNDGSTDAKNSLESINILKNLTRTKVTTSLEEEDKSLKLSSAEGTFQGNDCVLEIKIPGNLGDDKSRAAAGGYCFTDAFGWGDRTTKIELVDKDFVYAGTVYPATPEEAGIPDTSGMSWADIYPAGVVLGGYHDEDMAEENQGWRLWCEEGNQGGVDVDPLGGFAYFLAQCYLRITLTKTATSPATKAAVNLWAGKPENG